MINKILSQFKKNFKEPLTNYMYEFLMREAKYKWGRKPFGTEELRLLNEALVSQNLFGIDGKMVNNFEKEFSILYEVPYAVASTSGTAAIHTALGALNLNPGDEVITAPITDLGTVIPILSQNAVPVFADIDHTYNMDPEDVARKITPRTRAIVTVHLFGNPCNMDGLMEVAKKHNIPLIEDCSQTHLTKYKNRYVGTLGDIGCFSFQQSKHMTTGDGGMTVTSNKAYYDFMKLFVDKGYARKGFGMRAYAFHAPNYRMNELTGAVGLAQLKKVKNVVQKRQMMGTQLTELLKDVPELITPPITEGAEHSYWLYAVYLKNGDIIEFTKSLQASGFGCLAGYTGKPIYLCSESLTAKKTYGTSGFPFGSSYVSKEYEYKEGLCPKAEETLKHLVTMPWDESWDEERIKKAANAFKNTVQKLSPASIVVKESVANPVAPIPKNAENAIKKLRIGIVGCGQMGEWHWDGYRKNPNIEIAALVDTDISKAQRFLDKTPATIYTDYKEMIRNQKLDGVSVCTLPSTHETIVMDLLDAGINVLCEKPLAISLTQAEAMTKKAKEKNKVLLTAFKFRFFDEVNQAKVILDKNTLGKIINFRLMFGGHINMAGTWFADQKLSGGGVIIDNGPHAFDLIRYLLGDITNIQTHVSQIQNIPVEDTAQITCRLANGAWGTVDISWSNPLPSRTYLEIYAEEGTLLLDFEGLTYKYKTWADGKRIENTSSNKQAFNRQIDHFVATLTGKSATVTIVEDGLKAQLAIEQAYQSIK